MALARLDALLSASRPGLTLAVSWWERRNASTGAVSHGYSTSTYIAAGTGAPETFSTLDVFGGRYVQLSLVPGNTSAAAAVAASAPLHGLDAFDEGEATRYPRLLRRGPPPSASLGGPLNSAGSAAGDSITVFGANFTDVRYPLVLIGEAVRPCGASSPVNLLSPPAVCCRRLRRPLRPLPREALLDGCGDDRDEHGRLLHGLQVRRHCGPQMQLHLIAVTTAAARCSTRERVEWVGDATINIYNCTRTAFATLEDGPNATYTYADTRLLYGVLKRAALSGRAPYPNFFQVKAHTCSDRLDFNAVWTDQTLAWVSAFARYLAVSGVCDREPLACGRERPILTLHVIFLPPLPANAQGTLPVWPSCGRTYAPP